MNEKQLKEAAENMSVDNRVHILHDKENQSYTLGYIITGSDDQSLTLRAAGAFCSDKDMFCRRTGRTMVYGRLVTPRHENVHSSRGQCGVGPIVTGDLIVDCSMPTTAEQWRWLDGQVREIMCVDSFDDVPY